MNASTTSEAEAFYAYLGHELANGGKSRSPEQLLALWREREETIAAVQEGLADAEAGRMRPLRELLDEARRTNKAS